MAATGPGSAAINGKDDMGSAFVEAAKVTAAQIKKKYASGTFVLNTGQLNIDLVTLFAAAFTPNSKVHAILVRSDQNIRLRFNDVANDEVPVEAGAPFPFSALEMGSIFLSNDSGTNANINIILI